MKRLLTLGAVLALVSPALAQPQGHGQKSQNGGGSGHQNGAKAQAAGAHDGVDFGQALVAPQVVYKVDQNNGVVDHNAGQRDDADTTHDDAERLVRDQQPDEHTDGRHDYGGEDQ